MKEIEGNKVSEEFRVKELLKEERKNINSDEDLFNFIKNVKKNYNYGYGVAPRAIAQAGLATMNYLLSEMGCTGLQASCSCWDVIESFFHVELGAKIIRYDDMLYPQYQYKFNSKTISSSVWKGIQEKAEENLKDSENCNLDVVSHWQSIVDGVVPFGYRVED